MAYAATPAAAPATPAPDVEAFEEGKAPPTIDSHGGKLTPMTACWGGPDGATSLLLLLAILSTLAPRAIKGIDFSAVRLAPGLLLTAALAWNNQPSLQAGPPLPEKFRHVEAITTTIGGALMAVSFLFLLSDALMPTKGRASASSLIAMIAGGIAILVLPAAVGVDINALWNDGALGFDSKAVAGGYLGIPAGLGLLFAWRQFDGRLFDSLLIGGSIALMVAGSALQMPVVAFQTVAFAVVATFGAGLRGLGLPRWQGLTGRAAWIWGWIVRIALVMSVGSWTVF